MPDHSILDRALRWSGALRRKTDANAAFTQWLAEAATQTVTRKTIQDWFLELKNTGSDAAVPVADAKRILRQLRSEEHTSELQSLMRISYAVFCLKKKKSNTTCIHNQA